jgi:hypothetical protein
MRTFFRQGNQIFSRKKRKDLGGIPDCIDILKGQLISEKCWCLQFSKKPTQKFDEFLP